MQFHQSINHRANINRIIEMHDANIGLHAIVGTFADNGIHVRQEHVAGIIASLQPLSAKKLPKRASAALIKDKKAQDKLHGKGEAEA